MSASLTAGPGRRLAGIGVGHKARILAESFGPGMKVAEMARRNGLAPQRFIPGAIKRGRPSRTMAMVMMAAPASSSPPVRGATITTVTAVIGCFWDD